MDMRFDFSEVTAMASRYEGAEPIVRAEIRTGLERSVTQVEEDAKRVVPVLTHNLQRSITHEVVASGRDQIARVGTNVIYAKVVEYGHPRWPNRKPKPYLKPAFEKNRQAISREMGVAVPKRILARIGR